MKAVLSLALVFLWQVAAPAAESTRTAYSALRVIGKQSGADSLNRVVEVHGRFGAPEPDVWKVTLDDPGARGGLRELEVQHGQVISEKTPTAHSTGGRINFNQLNLDSEGVFSVVNQQAQKAGVTFDRVDYTLRSGAQKGSPVWHIDLLQGQNGRVGEFDVSADNGNVLHSDLTRKAPKAPVAVDDHAYVQPPPPVASVPPRRYPDDPRRYPDDTRRSPDDTRRYPEDTRRYADDQRPDVRPYPEDARRYPSDDRRYPDDRRPYPDDYRRDPDDDYDDRGDGTPIADKIGRHFEKRGRQFKNFFSGRGWTDQ